MTERLYYDDAYLTSFDAQVIACEPDEQGRFRVRLDRSAFYPTSGGQPFDTGTLGGATVIDVTIEEGDVIHVTDRPIAGAVRGEIDWPRRFDHMQQHCGEHMLANAVYRQLNGFTIGLHLGAEWSSIDVMLPDGAMHADEATIHALEDDVNAHIQQDLPIECTFPDAETLAAMPLRKAPTVDTHIRVVNIGNYEYCACGGTHPSSTGQVGLFKIVDARPSKGKLRLSFVCGQRAFLDYRAQSEALLRAAEIMSTGWRNLPESIAQCLKRVHDAEYEVGKLKKEMALLQVDALRASAYCTPSGLRVISHMAPGLAMPTLRELASALVAEPNTVALLASDTPDGGRTLLYARSADVEISMGALLGETARAFGGKGGGRPDFAQGGAPDERPMAMALDRLKQLGV